jgi:hypothetical protein
MLSILYQSKVPPVSESSKKQAGGQSNVSGLRSLSYFI